MKSTGSCIRCGIPLAPRGSKQGRQKLYCEEHRAEAALAQTKASQERKRLERLAAARPVYGPFLPSKRTRERLATAEKRAAGCRQCGGEITPPRAKFCSRKCSERHLSGVPRGPKPAYLDLECPECRTGFRQKSTQQRFCSSKCSTRHNRRARSFLRKRWVRSGEKFEPIEIFERDGWTCQLCGKATPRELMGRLHDDAPTMDHIKPWSAGGEHTRENVHCACWHCNVRLKNYRESLTASLVCEAVDPPKPQREELPDDGQRAPARV